MTGWDRDGIRSYRRLAACVALALLAGGCGESADQAEARRKKENKLPEQILIKFSGKVTIDGQPPQLDADHRLLIFLFDPKSPPPHGRPPRYTDCQKDGSFQFGQGVVPGSYVVLFAEFKPGRPGVFHGPDALKNLYNDPDKNAARDGFKVDLSSTGKTQDFNLEVAGKEAETPGPSAVINITRGAG
jgi:hypothetical protein